MVQPVAGGAEGDSAGARAARSSGGGWIRGGARAAADGGPMEPELEPAAVEVPAGRVLWCGPASGGAGHAEGAWGKGMGIPDRASRPLLPCADPASLPSPVPGSSWPPARGPRSCLSARMGPRTSSPTARRPRPSGCACAARSSGSCWRRSAWSACEGGGPGRGRGRRGGRTPSTSRGHSDGPPPHSSPGAVWWLPSGGRKRALWN